MLILPNISLLCPIFKKKNQENVSSLQKLGGIS